MGSPAVLDLEALLRAIPGDSEAGEDLRADLSTSPIYYQIKDARSAARASERQGEFDPVIGAAEANAWRSIIGPATDALASRTKDLELAAWMIEALVRTDGFAGMRDGLRLARELVERFWDGLYPRPDEDGLETTVAPLSGLNGVGSEGTLIAPLSRIPITRSKSVEPLASWNCNQAIELERLEEDARAERVAGGATSLAQVEVAVRETPVAFFVDLIADIEASLKELAALGAALDSRCGGDAPPMSGLREALESALATVRHIARDVLPAPSAPGGDEAAAPAAGPAPAASPAPAAAVGTLQTREDAFRTLAQVAEFFRTSDPHSPISFLVERTIRWGRLPLPELLNELIPDDGARETYGILTGVRAPARDED